MLKRIKHDDGNLIWFDYNEINIDELDSKFNSISKCDITNVPVEYIGRDICNHAKYRPCHIEMNNFYVTFFRDKNSSTGYSAMIDNKNKQIFLSHIGYTDNKPSSLTY